MRTRRSRPPTRRRRRSGECDGLARPAVATLAGRRVGRLQRFEASVSGLARYFTNAGTAERRSVSNEAAVPPVATTVSSATTSSDTDTAEQFTRHVLVPVAGQEDTNDGTSPPAVRVRSNHRIPRRGKGRRSAARDARRAVRRDRRRGVLHARVRGVAPPSAVLAGGCGPPVNRSTRGSRTGGPGRDSMGRCPCRPGGR